ncbi:SDR family oxidoreductase [Halomarina oriensis]|uniref:SDR family NAD(P)-dependent oxidoreductase n=1 Tax=Halomarina oriensis TaxID=671145 RepID=A0A6B0GGG0_9EURY|nr:SDR family oxidoreductase [Halomarina oriensis]MWG33600.1 SDR family NAD(P)-dependent oxidoreductase [Halomarina oriensis]
MTRTVLVTGCSSGVGRATALAFADDGWTVYATAREAADLDTLHDAGCETDSLDVTDDDAVARVVARIDDETGQIDCLVNCAGYAQFGALEDIPVEQSRAQYDVNVHGPHRLIRAVLPHMRERGSGRIVTVSGTTGLVAAPGGGVHCASKAALEAMHDALRVEVADEGIAVVVVEPEAVETGFDDRYTAEFENLDRSGAYDWLYRMYDDNLAVWGGGSASSSPEEVAAVILDAASVDDPKSRYYVGTAAYVSAAIGHLPDRVRDGLFGLGKRLLPVAAKAKSWRE